MRLVRLGQFVRTAQRDPESEFAGQCHDFLRFLPEQLPIISVKGRKIGADVAAQSALRKMNNISVRLTCLAQEFTDLPGVPPDIFSHRKLTRGNFYYAFSHTSPTQTLFGQIIVSFLICSLDRVIV